MQFKLPNLFKFGLTIKILGLSVLALFILPMLVGINDAGERTVVQFPNGSLFVKFTPGVYLKSFGKTTSYGDFLTFDFDLQSAKGQATLDQKGINVRYQDGGMGTVYGKARFSLPSDEVTMLELHKAFRSHKGLANKLVKPVTEEAMNLTAGLMTSEDAYATKRAIFTQMAKSQIGKGKFQTELKTIVVKDETTGKTVRKDIPVPTLDPKTKQPIHIDSDLASYGVLLSGLQLNDPGFEATTKKQIAQKREATMAIITAKANAERAKQEALTAEEKGKANVMRAKYEKEVEKEKAVVDAAREKEVAVIAAERQVAVAEQQKMEALVRASQRVEVAEQFKLEAEQKKLAAKEYKEEQTLRGEGDGTYKRLVMEADGALEQKLRTYENVMAVFATQFGKQKWVPEVQMGAGTGESNNAAGLIDILTAKTLKDLGLDMKIDTAKTAE